MHTPSLARPRTSVFLLAQSTILNYQQHTEIPQIRALQLCWEILYILNNNNNNNNNNIFVVLCSNCNLHRHIHGFQGRQTAFLHSGVVLRCV